MQDVKKIISENTQRFGEFVYYEILIEKIENNLKSHPDIAIEACKALIEGISKTILLRIDKTLSMKDMLEWQFQKLFNETTTKLGEANDAFEAEFISHFKHPIKLMGEIRTHRGDIAHGKPVPKTLSSSVEFAKFIEQFTNNIVVYLLEHFFSINFNEECTILYKDNPIFNNTLDEIFPLNGYIRYSKALYDQDYLSYMEQLKAAFIEENDYQREDNIEPDTSIAIYSTEDKKSDDKSSLIIELNTSEDIDDKFKDLINKEELKEAIYALCSEEKLYINEVLNIIESYLFDKRTPLSSDIVSAMKIRPKALERKSIAESLTKKILSYIHQNLSDKL